MVDDLYFISLLARAFREPVPEAALQRALEEIESRGRQPRYRQGYRQFEAFLTAARGASPGTDGERYAGTGAGFEPPGTEPAGGSDQLDVAPWPARGDAVPTDSEADIELELIRGRVVVARGTMRATRLSLENAVPGRYALQVQTGWVLWQDELTPRDLLWARAFPGRPLAISARTGPSEQPASRHLTLLGGRLVLRVLPGLEAGRIEVLIHANG